VDEGLGSESRTQTESHLRTPTASKHNLSHVVQLVKAIRWVQLGNTLLDGIDPECGAVGLLDNDERAVGQCAGQSVTAFQTRLNLDSPG